MASPQLIRHEGTVESTSNGSVRVRILQSSACAGCSAAKLCQSSETKEKVVDVRVSSPESYFVGQSVTVVGSIRQGLRATLWAYVIPLLLVVVVIAVCFLAHLSDALSAMAGLGVLAIYYIIMYIMRAKFERSFTFELE